MYIHTCIYINHRQMLAKEFLTRGAASEEGKRNPGICSEPLFWHGARRTNPPFPKKPFCPQRWGVKRLLQRSRLQNPRALKSREEQRLGSER